MTRTSTPTCSSTTSGYGPTSSSNSKQSTSTPDFWANWACTWVPLMTYSPTPPTNRPSVCCCANPRTNVVAEYALRNSTMPIGIAEWATAITTDLPDELTSALPRIEDIEAELE